MSRRDGTAVLRRESATSLVLDNEHGVPVRVFANEEVELERDAVEELGGVLELSRTAARLHEAEPTFFDSPDAGIARVAITPDFHKGAGIPVGTVMLARGMVVPQAIGTDINCGMRLLVTDLTEERVRGSLPRLEGRLRHLFFEGGRQIPMCRAQREAMLREGLAGVLATHRMSKGEGVWRWYDEGEQERALGRAIGGGGMRAERVVWLDDYLGHEGQSFDSQIGSIGGGNHFVEIQRVKSVLDSHTAYAWGLRPGNIVVMIHTGCVSIGYPTGTRFRDTVREIFPKALRHPENGIFPLPTSERFGDQWRKFWASFCNAANFAFANRMFLGLMMRQALEETVGEHKSELLYDAGHNVITEEVIDGERFYLHRKGATPARGGADLAGTEFEYTGEPVLIPGSMGAPSFIMAGMGSRESLMSASHGAGRAMSRGRALRHDDRLLEEFLAKFRVVTPVDPARHDIKGRPDILRKYYDDLKQEAPYAYKPVGAVIRTQTEAGIVRAVAEVEPILTMKG